MLQEFLRDRSKVQMLVQQLDPVVRAIDGIAGERVSMRVRSYTVHIKPLNPLGAHLTSLIFFLTIGRNSKYRPFFEHEVLLSCFDRLIWSAQMDVTPLEYFLIEDSPSKTAIHFFFA